MINLINFDNSAASFPKPSSVSRACLSALSTYSGNPGRGGHRLSLITSQQVFRVRSAAAEMFHSEPENTVFTPNCTLALNMAIKGIMQNGGHMIISDHEHNAAFRPVYALAKKKLISFSLAHVFDDDEQTLDGIRRLIRSDTKCVCCVAASNVTGRILPYRQIAALCRSYGLCFITDAAQAAGILDISLDDGMNFICTAGQKALYGPSGTGLLISDGSFPLSTIIEGGTGTTSAEPDQSPMLPERLESGTVNTMGILGLGAGIEFVKSRTPQKIFSHEASLCRQLEYELSSVRDIKFYSCPSKVPVLSFNLGDIPSQKVSAALSEKGFALRGGIHCAPLPHKVLGTISQGTVRFSPGIFSSPEQVSALAAAVRKTAAEL